jgi:hypothetical protein
MKRFRFLSPRAAWAALCFTPPLTAQTVVDFADVALGSPPTTAYAEGGVYYNGSDLAGGFSSGGVSFVTDYNSEWGSWTGWAYSTTTDVGTAGWDNQYSAFAGSGDGDAVYAIGYVGFAGLSLELPGPVSPLSVALTNTSYAGLSMTHGDAFAKKFGGPGGTDPDTFILSITGLDGSGATTGAVDVYLADFRSADPAADYILDTWLTVDLTALGSGVTELVFALGSTDVGAWGMNTPSYFAMDTLRFVAVPEAGLLPALLGLLALFAGLRRRR